MTSPAIEFRYDPQHAAVIVIDMQADYCTPDGALARLGKDTSGAQRMAPRLNDLLTAARSVRMPVIFVRTTHGPSDDSPAWLNRYGRNRGEEPPGVICREDDPVGCAWFGVAPEAGELVVTKHRYSAFAGTSLAMKLRTMGIDSLLFTGVATEICVESSLRDGLFEDFYVSLIEDCAASFSEESHRASADVVGANFGSVVKAEELKTMWSRATLHA